MSTPHMLLPITHRPEGWVWRCSVATGQGRDAIGIDIDSRNADLALDRVGPLLLTVEHLSDEVAS